MRFFPHLNLTWPPHEIFWNLFTIGTISSDAYIWILWMCGFAGGEWCWQVKELAGWKGGWTEEVSVQRVGSAYKEIFIILFSCLWACSNPSDYKVVLPPYFPTGLQDSAHQYWHLKKYIRRCWICKTRYYCKSQQLLYYERRIWYRRKDFPACVCHFNWYLIGVYIGCQC